MKMPRSISLYLLSLLVLLGVNAQANVHSVEDYDIHYSVINTSALSPDVASKYGIERSQRVAMVNIAVQRKGKPVPANVFGKGRNLTGQLIDLRFNEVIEGDAIYYLATYRINDGEKIQFELQVQPEKKGVLIPLNFSKQMYVQ